MGIFREIFTWWNGQTLGTRLFTSRKGQLVGEDDAGNRYYQTSDGARRWVIYEGEAEASRVPPDWHGWLHHTFKEPPTEKPFVVKPWEQPHQPNLTGTPEAYRPTGSLTRPEASRDRVARDYEPWSPS